MKKCPYCAEEIQDAAIVCRYCGHDLKSDYHTKKEKLTEILQEELSLTQSKLAERWVNEMSEKDMTTRLLESNLMIIEGTIKALNRDKFTLSDIEEQITSHQQSLVKLK